MGATVLLPSTASRGAPTVPRACAARSRIGINPACVARPAAAPARKPKRPGSFRGGEPPAKRVRDVCSDGDRKGAAAATRNKNRTRPSSSQSSLRVTAVAVSVIKNLSSASQGQINPAGTAPSKSSISSMSELIAKARLAAAEANHLREIEHRRAEARRQIEQVVRTVEFNDAFIDPRDVLK